MSILVDESLCVGCRDCVPHCPDDAMEVWPLVNVVKVDLVKCTNCLICIDRCSYDALSAVGILVERSAVTHAQAG
jgi:NAD-dependent dihydropyrimidine dehydrogenase PreA subunit